MKKFEMLFTSIAVCLLLLLPGGASADSLDSYYLSAFDAVYGRHSQARALAQEAPATVSSGRSLTPLYHDVRRDWKRLHSETRSALAKYLAKPTLQGEHTLTSSAGHFLVHYATVGSSVPDLTDGNGNGAPDWIEAVAAVFEHVYEVEVGQMGYRQAATAGGAPYDVYLQDLSGAGEYGYTDTAAPVSPGSNSYTSYIVIDKSMTSSVYAPYTGMVGLQITAAHEYHHAVQYTYNYYLDIWYAEATSTWIEDEVYDSGNQLYSYLPVYFNNSAYALDTPSNVSTGGGYSRWLFNRYLVEKYGTGIIKGYWERLAQTAAPADGSDIPGLPFLADTVRGYSGDLAQDFFSFAKRLYLRNWSTHTGDIGLIAAYQPEAAYSQYPVQGGSLPAPQASLGRYSFAYYRFLPSSSAPLDLTITVSGQGLSVAAFRKTTDGTITEYAPDSSSGAITIPSFNTSDTAEAVLLVCNGTLSSLTGSFSTGGTGTSSSLQQTVSGVGAASGGKSGCFIATAAFGSYLHPKVMVLRHFRDRYLLTNAPGRAFVALYYRTSPPIAAFIARHESARAVCRCLLAPLIVAVEHTGVVGGAFLMCFLAVAGRFRAARRRLLY